MDHKQADVTQRGPREAKGKPNETGVVRKRSNGTRRGSRGGCPSLAEGGLAGIGSGVLEVTHGQDLRCREGGWGVRYDDAADCGSCLWITMLLQLSLHTTRFQAAPPREGTAYCEEEACAKGRHGSSLTGCSSFTDREVGEGGAQRLLPHGGHVAAAVEGEGGESGEASQLAQPLVGDVVTVD